MRDAIDLNGVQVHDSPVDIAGWPATVAITQIEMNPHGGLTLTFDRLLPQSWKWRSNPDDPTQNYQYTVWAVIRHAAAWHTAGFIEMWEGRVMGDRSLPPILGDVKNWWGDADRSWGEMSDYVPQAGDLVAFFVSAGAGRKTSGVTSVRERSNVVEVKLPDNDFGLFRFPAGEPTPAPVPRPQPAPSPAPSVGYDEGEVVAFAQDCDALLHPDSGRVGVNCARMQFDAATMGYEASRAKHLAELHAEVGR